MSDEIVFPYDFDPYQENSSNQISSEAHTITAANGTDFNFIVPRYAPFFRRGFVCRNTTTGVTLRPDVDYFFGFRFDQIIVSGSQLPVYGAIVFNDKSLSANIEIDYHTLGGEFCLDENSILQLMANKAQDPRSLQWGAVVNLPTEFPPIAHRHDADDMTGFSEVISAIYSLSDSQTAGFNKAMQSLLEHIADHNNPHHITLADLGIDDLGNLVPASKEQAEGGTDNTYYMTSLRTSQQFQAIFQPMLQEHEDDQSNPHGVTKAQVGLDLVPNYRTANSLESSAGVADNLLLTPSGGRILANALVPGIMEFHTANTNNPHGVTKTQVGLGNVPNYATATEEEALAGVSKTTLLTPYLANLMLTNSTDQPLAAHLLDYNNPHQVTATQVGLGNVSNYGTATNDQTLLGTATNLFTTPAGIAYWWTNSAKMYVDQAIEQGTNLTAVDVGLGNVVNAGFATTAENQAGTATQTYVDPAGVTTALTSNVLVRNYSCQPSYIAKLISGFPAGGLVASSTRSSTGVNKEWSSTLRTVTSPLHSASQVSALITPAPASYSQRAYVDVATGTSIPGFIFGYYQDSNGNENYAGIFFKNGAVYLGTYIAGVWTTGSDVALAALTGASVQVTCTLSGTTMSVTVASTTVTVNVSSVTFTPTTFASMAGFIVNGKDALVFTPTSFGGLTYSIVDVISHQSYKYSASAWAVDTVVDLSGLPAELRVGRLICNLGSGESFVPVSSSGFAVINPPTAV
ncbi:virion structural protein [Klebsiella phage vB_KpM_FBKp24]|uniref:Putative tail fiber protein n=1 Tax=Klebsiella phage vB_KpM_FBKp24 TaxID=2801834 RepID=A0A7U0J6L0_9CAUD|nr:virion structural protein [Klebsiella phage vB_KpM_FBKp24]QQV92006.1 putative tail fiber protein [Klebsiella phage vB_KpM_FBKp24]